MPLDLNSARFTDAAQLVVDLDAALLLLYIAVSSPNETIRAKRCEEAHRLYKQVAVRLSSLVLTQDQLDAIQNRMLVLFDLFKSIPSDDDGHRNSAFQSADL